MLWFYMVLFGGCLAAVFFLLSGSMIGQHKRTAGYVFAALELLSAAVSSGAWMYALKISGKTDWFLCGLFGYTPIALIFYAMFAVGFGCIAVNACGGKREQG